MKYKAEDFYDTELGHVMTKGPGHILSLPWEQICKDIALTANIKQEINLIEKKELLSQIVEKTTALSFDMQDQANLWELEEIRQLLFKLEKELE